MARTRAACDHDRVSDVRVRAPRWRGLPRVGYRLPFLGLITANTWWLYSSGPEPWLLAPWGLIVAAAVLRTGLDAFRPEGVDLQDDVAVIVVFPFLTRRVPWRDVQGIAVEGRSVVLYRETGKPVRAPYPSPSWFVPRQRFEADYHRIGQWWLAHRGPDWHPLVPVAPPRA
jgi:hypothetical protein